MCRVADIRMTRRWGCLGSRSRTCSGAAGGRRVGSKKRFISQSCKAGGRAWRSLQRSRPTPLSSWPLTLPLPTHQDEQEVGEAVTLMDLINHLEEWEEGAGTAE